MRRIGAILKSADRHSVVVLLGGTLLQALYLYQGHPRFFLAYLTCGVACRSPFAEWHAHLWEFGVMFLLLAAVPALLARRFLGLGLADQGVRLGDVRCGAKVALLALPFLIVGLYITSLDPAFQAEYPLTKLAGLSVWTFVAWQASRLVYYAAWEYFFRGFMLFSLEKRFGAFAAIAIQTVPSTLIHIGKPQGEMLAAILGGVLLGALALRTRSILFPFLIHWVVGGLMDGFSLLGH